jgi:hypothetical protein
LPDRPFVHGRLNLPAESAVWSKLGA